VWQVGMVGLRLSVQALGLWLVPFLLLDSVSLWLHTVGWQASFRPDQHALRLWQLGVLRLAGSAVNWVIPVAGFGGEVVKVLLLEATMPRTQAAASVVIDKTSFLLAQMFYLVLGMLCLIKFLPLPDVWRWRISLSLGLISLGLIGFVVCQRYGLLSHGIRWLSGLGIGQAMLQRLSQRLAPFDAQLRGYYIAHPWRFVASLVFHILAFAFDGVQTYVLLYLLLGDEAPGLAQALMVAITVTALDQMFFFVTANLGTLEASRFLVLSALGSAQVYGPVISRCGRLGLSALE
jgi:hypothetical protein